MTDRGRKRESGERIQKLLSRAGVASRRGAEDLIRAGRVTVNGVTVTELGTRAFASDELRVDGKLVDPEPDFFYVLLHKPGGCLSTRSDPQGRPTVLDLLPDHLDVVFPVGRLDWSTEGLLLLTNDGDLAHRLAHPRFGMERVYAVKLKGLIDPKDPRVLQMLRGVSLGRLGTARARGVQVSGRSGRHTWITLVLTEGKNREVRRICEAVGLQVLKLKRLAFGPLELGDLARGQWRELTAHEVATLRAALERRASRKGSGEGG